jgi:hypothetical protein
MHLGHDGAVVGLVVLEAGADGALPVDVVARALPAARLIAPVTASPSSSSNSPPRGPGFLLRTLLQTVRRIGSDGEPRSELPDGADTEAPSITLHRAR